VLCTHRYYDPTTGHWLSRDPIGYAGGQNLYGYAGGNPINEIDPEGEKKAVIYVGSTGIGPIQQLFANWGIESDIDDLKDILSYNGYNVTVISNADKNNVLSTIGMYDGAVFIGHSDSDNGAFQGVNFDIYPGDIKNALKGRILDFAILHSCHTNTPAWRNATVGNHPAKFYGSTGFWDPVLGMDLSHPNSSILPSVLKSRPKTEYLVNIPYL